MRRHPLVCFQVDQMESTVSWRSVIVQEKFEELESRSMLTYAGELFKERLGPLTNSEVVHSTTKPLNAGIIEKELKSILYRISVLEVTGRYEKPNSNSH